jgi:MYXO-CTERM domain-containing protein
MRVPGVNPLRRVWAWAAVAGVLATAGQARAFYWNGWPGSKVPPPRTLIQPKEAGNPRNPPRGPNIPGGPLPELPPGGTPEVPPGGSPEIPPVTPPPPESIPEPASGLLGLVGLAAAIAARRWRQRK